MAHCHSLACSSRDCKAREASLTQEVWGKSGFSRLQSRQRSKWNNAGNVTHTASRSVDNRMRAAEGAGLGVGAAVEGKSTERKDQAVWISDCRGPGVETWSAGQRLLETENV